MFDSDTETRSSREEQKRRKAPIPDRDDMSFPLLSRLESSYPIWLCQSSSDALLNVSPEMSLDLPQDRYG